MKSSRFFIWRQMLSEAFFFHKTLKVDKNRIPPTTVFFLSFFSVSLSFFLSLPLPLYLSVCLSLQFHLQTHFISSLAKSLPFTVTYYIIYILSTTTVVCARSHLPSTGPDDDSTTFRLVRPCCYRVSSEKNKSKYDKKKNYCQRKNNQNYYYTTYCYVLSS